jgi:hypothetical protein
VQGVLQGWCEEEVLEVADDREGRWAGHQVKTGGFVEDGSD